MSNINIVLAENILRFRKEKNLTQKELAEKVGVTYQAVSKWENASSAPDIMFLPILADVFECRIDSLFSRTNTGVYTAPSDTHCSALPWRDDDVIRGVVCIGQRILQVTDGLVDKFTFELVGDAKAVKSECNLSVVGSVNGGCRAGSSIDIGGNSAGGINCGAYVSIGGGHNGGINCGAYVSCGGDIHGGINCGAAVSCNDLHAHTIRCGNTISAAGDVKANSVHIKRGEIVCNSFNCDQLKGFVKVKTKE